MRYYRHTDAIKLKALTQETLLWVHHLAPARGVVRLRRCAIGLGMTNERGIHLYPLPP